MKKLLMALCGLSLFAVSCETHEVKKHESRESAPAEHKEIKAPETKTNGAKANEIKNGAKPAAPAGN